MLEKSKWTKSGRTVIVVLAKKRGMVILYKSRFVYCKSTCYSKSKWIRTSEKQFERSILRAKIPILKLFWLASLLRLAFRIFIIFVPFFGFKFDKILVFGWWSLLPSFSDFSVLVEVDSRVVVWLVSDSFVSSCSSWDQSWFSENAD